MQHKTDPVMIATVDDDVTLCEREAMARVGAETAKALRQTVTARDATTDELLATYEPDPDRLFKVGDRVTVRSDYSCYVAMSDAVGEIVEIGMIDPTDVMVQLGEVTYQCAPCWLEVAP